MYVLAKSTHTQTHTHTHTHTCTHTHMHTHILQQCHWQNHSSLREREDGLWYLRPLSQIPTQVCRWSTFAFTGWGGGRREREEEGEHQGGSWKLQVSCQDLAQQYTKGIVASSGLRIGKALVTSSGSQLSSLLCSSCKSATVSSSNLHTRIKRSV